MTNKKRGDYVRDAADVIDPATDLVRIKEVRAKATELLAHQVAITQMCIDARRWLLGLINANGWTNIDAAKALGLNVNRIGALITGKSESITEDETSLMLERMLLIDVDSSSALGEKSSPEVVPIRHKAG